MGDGNDQSASTVNTDATSSTGAQAMSFTMEQLNTIIQSAITGALAAQVNTGSQSTHQARHPEPPSISLDCNEGRWSFFTNEWKMYKTQAKLPENAPAELRNCCSEDLRFTLFELLGPSIDDLNEKDLMEKIHKVAVKRKNTAVHRQEFYNMKQEEGQSAQQLLAKLRAAVKIAVTTLIHMHQQWWLTFSLWDAMTRTYKGNSLPALQMSSHYRTSLS